MDQSATPLVNALKHCASRANAPFHTPGHKRGQGITQQHRELFGTQAFRADLPELPDLDNLFAPEGVILQAQQLAAEAFGAEQTWFLANGSTCGIEAAILATCGPGDKIILPRNVHSSAISGLILSGAIPIYITPGYSHDWDLPLGVEAENVQAALDEHPDTKAVLIVSPTYHGIGSDIGAIARITHMHNIPLIVDEAHAPHFAFHPELPPTALTSGADIAIQSAHKVLSAFTQSALLHIQGNRTDSNRLSQCLQLTQSTSPSYLLLGSLDAARHQMATDGLSLMTQTLALADRAFTTLSAFKGLRVLKLDQGLSDRTRLTVDVSGLGLTGFEADDILHEQFNVTAELPALQHIMFIVSLGNTPEDITHLIEGFQGLCQQHQPIKQSAVSFKTREHTAVLSPSLARLNPPSPQSPNRLTPRQAFFSSKTATPIDQTLGHICGETICPYPPGIPTLLPGEPITETAITHLQSILQAGGTLTGCQDPTLKTILTVTA